MCLYLREKQPRVAKEDITVLKYVILYDGIVSPYQFTKIPVNEVLTASPNKENIESFGKDLLGNDVYSISGGAIHAKLIKGELSGCVCRKAIIPSGTEYWVNVHGDEIAARSMIVTDVDWDNGVNKVSESVFEEILENAPKVNDIRIGDYLLENGDYTRPCKGLSEDNVIGIVAGFHGGKPLITALTFFDCVYDKDNSSEFGDYYHFKEYVIKTFNGRTITEKYRDGSKDDRFEAFEACINYRKDKDEKWYLGAAGEVATMLDNCIYLNAAHHITGLGFLIGNEWYNSCSEKNCEYSWRCSVSCNRVSCCSDSKRCERRTVPFLSL